MKKKKPQTLDQFMVELRKDSRKPIVKDHLITVNYEFHTRYPRKSKEKTHANKSKV